MSNVEPDKKREAGTLADKYWDEVMAPEFAETGLSKFTNLLRFLKDWLGAFEAWLENNGHLRM